MWNLVSGVFSTFKIPHNSSLFESVTIGVWMFFWILLLSGRYEINLHMRWQPINRILFEWYNLHMCLMFKMCGPLCVCSWYYLSLVNSIKFILGLCVLFLVGRVNCSNSMSLDDVSCFWQRIPFCLYITDICFLNNSWMFAYYFAVLLFNVWLIKLFSDCSNVFPRFSCFT